MYKDLSDAIDNWIERAILGLGKDDTATPDNIRADFEGNLLEAVSDYFDSLD